MKITNAVTPSLDAAPPSNRPRTARRKISLTVMALLCLAIGRAFGQLDGFSILSATATISSSQSGPNFNYTITLHNTGSLNIGTFWFAWTPPGMPIEYDFLPSAPSSISQPTGWFGLSSLGFPGYSIEYYNSTGSLIGPGQTGTFHFSSPDSPTTLQSSTFGFPNTTSFIYAGSPEVGSTAQVSPVFVPEPSTYGLLAAGAISLLTLRWRRRITRE